MENQIKQQQTEIASKFGSLVMKTNSTQKPKNRLLQYAALLQLHHVIKNQTHKYIFTSMPWKYDIENGPRPKSKTMHECVRTATVGWILTLKKIDGKLKRLNHKGMSGRCIIIEMVYWMVYFRRKRNWQFSNRVWSKGGNCNSGKLVSSQIHTIMFSPFCSERTELLSLADFIWRSYHASHSFIRSTDSDCRAVAIKSTRKDSYQENERLRCTLKM